MSDSSKRDVPRKGSPAYEVESVANALRLVRAMDERGGLRIFEAAELLGVAPSTAHRLLATLGRSGFVTKDQEKPVYRIGQVLLQIGIRAYTRLDMRFLAMPHLERLAAEIDETVHLIMLEGINIRFVDGVESTQLLRVGLQVGRVLPAATAASGRAMLATMSPAEVRSLYEDSDVSTPRSGRPDLVELAQELEETSRRGYGLMVNEDRGTAAVAVAMRDLARRSLAAIGVTAPQSRLQPSRVIEIADRLQCVASQISAVITTEQPGSDATSS